MKWASLMMATILPILASGRGDLSGRDRDNATTTQLFSTSNYEMNLHLWNERIGSIWMMAGDLEMKVTNVAENFGGSVCIGFPDAPVVEGEEEAVEDTANRFDCLSFGISLIAENLESTELESAVIDQYQVNGPSLKTGDRMQDDSVDS